MNSYGTGKIKTIKDNGKNVAAVYTSEKWTVPYHKTEVKRTQAGRYDKVALSLKSNKKSKPNRT